MARREAGRKSPRDKRSDAAPVPGDVSAEPPSLEARLAGLLPIAADAVILLDHRQRILLFNEGAERIFGWRAEEVAGRPLDILLPERLYGAQRRHVTDFVASPVAARRMGERREVFGRRKDGEEFPVEASIAKSGRGADATFSVVLRDVGGRVRVEEELRRRERQLQEAQAMAHLGSWEWRVAGDSVDWSDEMYRIYGLTPGSVEITFEGYLSRVHPADREKVRALVRRAYERGGSFSSRHRIVRSDGSARVLQSHGNAVVDDEGRTVRMVGTCQDVTERVRAERRARRLAGERAARAEAERAARRMEFLIGAGRALSSSLDHGAIPRQIADLAVPFLAESCVVFLADDEGMTLRLAASAHSRAENEALIEGILERYLPDLENRDSVLARVYRTADHRLLSEIPSEVLERALASRPEVLELARNLIPGSALIVPLATRGRRLGVIALYRSGAIARYTEPDAAVAQRLAGTAALALDNARLYQSERWARTEAEEAATLRDEVLAIVSHDLRSPLHAIALCGELLGREGREEQRQAHVQILRNAVQRMSRLVEDLLDVGRIETGRFAVRTGLCEPGDLVERAVEIARPAATEKGIELGSRVSESLPRVPADRRRIEQVFSNLLDNAIRHTPRGGRIDVSARVADDGLRFSVVDSGEGIPPASRGALFGRFPAVRGVERDRTGLGLMIARGIVEAHGGRVWVESEPGEGAAFHFTIPATPAAPVPGDTGGPSPRSVPLGVATGGGRDPVLLPYGLQAPGRWSGIGPERRGGRLSGE